MYKSRKFNKVSKSGSTEIISRKRTLNTIDENGSLKQQHMDNANILCKTQDNEERNETLNSEENIPASQEPTQRYLSQRSVTAGALVRTQSRLTQRQPNSYFELELMKSGVQLDDVDYFVLSCDHIAFVGKLREALIKSQNYPENVETFVTGMRDALNVKSKMLHKLLGGCTISIPGESSVYQSQDSMLVNFLMIDVLCDPVLQVLLEKIEEMACGTSTLPANDRRILTLLLAQLRYVTPLHGNLVYMHIKCIFQKCSEFAKWDIIASAEFILDSSKHDEFVQMLLDMSSKDLFEIRIVQTLKNLCLSPKMQGKLRNKMLEFIKENQCPNRTFPHLINFFLKILNVDTDECVRELVASLRDILVWKEKNNQSVLDSQSQLELCSYMKQGFMCSRRFFDIWQKTIFALPASQFKCIDFIVLLVMINVKEDRALQIQNIIRRRILSEHIKVDILYEIKSKFCEFINMHIDTVMRTLYDFLRDKEESVKNFARASYSILFEIGDSIQKTILKNLLEFTCDKSSPNMTNLALELLKDLQRKYAEEVHNWAMLFMPLLDRVNEMSLSQTRIAMGLLCSMAYPAPKLTEYPALQDQTDMMVKKQLISHIPFVKNQGIIGSVQLIDNMARVEETIIEMDDFNTTYSTMSDLPEGRGKIAAQCIIRIHSSAMNCPESLALFYDELANIFGSSAGQRSNAALHDKPFLMWVCELMTYYFQNSFVAEYLPERINGMDLSYQKCINSLEDTSTEGSELPSIAVNIAELVLKPAKDASSSILVLAPLFNLVRVLHLQRYDGSLELINALLGCAIILPTFFDDAETLFYDYDVEIRSKILDIYFHCVSWIRETVSSFTTQREDMIRSKVLMRLSDLIKIEGKIKKLLQKAPADYTPPMCQFTSNSSTSKAANFAGRERTASNPSQREHKLNDRHDENENRDLTSCSRDVNNANITIAGRSLKPTGIKKNFENLYGPKEIYRQMDSNIMLILREKLIIRYPLPEEEIGKAIGLLEYRFVLNDLVNKLETFCGVSKCSNSQILQYITKPLFFLMDLSKFLGAISRNMELLATAICEELQNVKHVYGHTDLFSDEFSLLKTNFCLSFRILAVFFSWPEFLNARKNSDFLKESLLSLLDQTLSQQFIGESNYNIAREVFSKYQNYDLYIVDLKTAVYLYKFLISLQKLSHGMEASDEGIREKQANEIRNLCKKFLMRKWYNCDGCMESGATCNMLLDELVKGFLKKSDLRRQREILRVLLDEVKQLSRKDNALKSFPNFRKANFPLLFRGMCEIMIISLNEILCSNVDGPNDKLRVWEKSCELLNMLLEILQVLDLPRNFQLFLKYSHMYLKLVLQHGLPICEHFLRQNTERVSELLRSLQVTTRFLHNLCCHSKAIKNTTIVSQIPYLRQTVETLVFRVKALLTANKCASVFWMGNLKNKDLHGDELLSQSASLDTARPDSDEEIPDDDMSADETVLDHNEYEHSFGGMDCVNTNRSKSSSRSKCF